MSGYTSQKNIVFFSMKIFFTFTNSADPDEMQHYAAFYLGRHCFQKYSFRGFPEYKGLIFMKDLGQFPIQSAQILTACCKDNA